VAFTNWGGQKMCYDVLGNLVSDITSQLYDMDYDYRNLMTHATVARTIDGGMLSGLNFEYDEAGTRIRKQFCYDIWGCCEESGGEDKLLGGGDETDDAGGLLDGGGPDCPEGEYPCIKRACAETFYLYDGGALLATFDERDSVIDLFVNGPTGRLATYWHNDPAQLYYFVSDHTGSPRVIMSPSPTPHVVAWYNYYPFGDLKDSWTAYDTPFKFTGKERDDHTSFHYYYFGARYYDPYLGRFTSIDKAGQFASGYLYGGNNPIMGVDPDGNLWWVPIMISALAGAYSGYGIAQAYDENIFNYMMGGAIFGAVSGLVGSAVAGAHFPSSAAAGFWSGAAGGGTYGLGMGLMCKSAGDGASYGDVLQSTWKSALSGGLGGLTSSAVGGIKGAFAGGFVGGSVGYGLSAKNAEFDEILAYGLAGGALSAGSYAIESSIRYHRKAHDALMDQSIDSRKAMSAAAQESFLKGREEGGWFTKGGPTRAPHGDAKGINLGPRPENAVGTYHTQIDVGSIASGKDIITTKGLNLDGIVVTPRDIYSISAGLEPVHIGSTNEFLMVNYYNLYYYGEYRY
jgi:RHS repeat-associated protein